MDTSTKLKKSGNRLHLKQVSPADPAILSKYFDISSLDVLWFIRQKLETNWSKEISIDFKYYEHSVVQSNLQYISGIFRSYGIFDLKENIYYNQNSLKQSLWIKTHIPHHHHSSLVLIRKSILKNQLFLEYPSALCWIS